MEDATRRVFLPSLPPSLPSYFKHTYNIARVKVFQAVGPASGTSDHAADAIHPLRSRQCPALQISML